MCLRRERSTAVICSASRKRRRCSSHATRSSPSLGRPTTTSCIVHVGLSGHHATSIIRAPMTNLKVLHHTRRIVWSPCQNTHHSTNNKLEGLVFAGKFAWILVKCILLFHSLLSHDFDVKYQENFISAEFIHNTRRQEPNTNPPQKRIRTEGST